jgi:ribose-phosphate pyrophosphokinase
MSSEPLPWSPRFAAPPLRDGSGLRLFALQATADLGTRVAQALGHPLAGHEERTFEDGEYKLRPLGPAAEADVYVVQSLHGGPEQSASDKLCRLLFFIATLKDCGARQVTAVVPYLCYARKDRRTKPQDPVTLRYVAALFEAVGTDAVVTLEVHNPAAFENAFRCRTVTLTAAPLFIDHLRPWRGDKVSVISPDPGGVKRAELFREALEAAWGEPVAKGFVDKRRSAGVLSGDRFVGEAEGMTVIVVDDLISTGRTLARAAQAVGAAGASRVVARTAHGLFMSGASDALADPALERVMTTDTVPAFRLGADPVRSRIDCVPASPLLAEAIRRLHAGAPLTDLLVC